MPHFCAALLKGPRLQIPQAVNEAGQEPLAVLHRGKGAELLEKEVLQEGKVDRAGQRPEAKDTRQGQQHRKGVHRVEGLEIVLCRRVFEGEKK